MVRQDAASAPPRASLSLSLDAASRCPPSCLRCCPTSRAQSTSQACTVPCSDKDGVTETLSLQGADLDLCLPRPLSPPSLLPPLAPSCPPADRLEQASKEEEIECGQPSWREREPGPDGSRRPHSATIAECTLPPASRCSGPWSCALPRPRACNQQSSSSSSFITGQVIRQTITGAADCWVRMGLKQSSRRMRRGWRRGGMLHSKQT